MMSGQQMPRQDGSGGVFARRERGGQTGTGSGMHHQHSDKMRTLFMHSSQVYTAKKRQGANPMWLEFPDRCQKPIESVEEMRRLLKYHSDSDDVMMVRYHQSGCTACNAVDKVVEMMCHDMRNDKPKLHFYDVKRDEVPELTKGLVRYPQVKAFNGGQWADMDFKPPQDYRDSVYAGIEKEVHAAAKRGKPLTAQQAEEMYFSVSGPAIAIVLEESITKFYNQTQVRLHNYWKQVAQRRSWFYKKYIADPEADQAMVQDVSSSASLFGEAVGAVAEEQQRKADDERRMMEAAQAQAQPA